MGRVARLEAALRSAARWHAARSRRELAGAAAAALAALVPCDDAVWTEVDARSRSVVLGAADAPEALRRNLHQHPVVRHLAETGDGAAVRFSDLLSQRAYRRLELYQDYYRHEGVEYVLAAAAAVEPVEVGVSLRRERRDFSDEERRLLELLRPHLAAAHAAASERELADALRRGLEHERRGVLVLDGGRVVEATPLGLSLLRRWFGGVPPTGPMTLESDDARLVVRRADDLLLLDERRLAPEPARVRELGLTRREGEVVALAGRGLTDVQIAGRLVVSVRTVQKHLEHAYAKLGVSSRAAAAAALLATLDA